MACGGGEGAREAAVMASRMRGGWLVLRWSQLPFASEATGTCWELSLGQSQGDGVGAPRVWERGSWGLEGCGMFASRASGGGQAGHPHSQEEREARSFPGLLPCAPQKAPCGLGSETRSATFHPAQSPWRQTEGPSPRPASRLRTQPLFWMWILLEFRSFAGEIKHLDNQPEESQCGLGR